MYLLNVPLYMYLFDVPLYLHVFIPKTMVLYCSNGAISPLSGNNVCTSTTHDAVVSILTMILYGEGRELNLKRTSKTHVD